MSPQRLKQLEAENAALAKSLAQVCDENASLIHQVVSLEEKTVELAQAPLKQTSVLRSLYEPSKSGWFGGSKSTTREQLEKLTEALQNEFMEYKSSHASSNEEFSALMSELKRSTAHAAELGKVIHDQQQRLSVATSAAHHHDDMSRRSSTTADPDGYEEEVKGLRKQCAELSTQLLKAQQQIKTSDGELARIRKELRSVSEGRDALKAEVSQHQFDAEFDRSKAEADVLRKEVEQLREALAAEERLHGLKSEESAKRAARIEELTATHAEEIQALKQSLQAEKAHSSSSDCPNCARTHQDLLALQDQLEESRKNAVAARSQLAETTSVHEQRFAAMEAKMLETQAHLDEKESQIAHSVTADAYAQVQADNKRLNHELTLRQSRITHLETLQKSSSTTSSPSMKGIMVGGTELDEAEVIETIDALNERVSRLEFERDEVKSQMEQAKTFAVERNEEAQRAERSAAEEKQRVAFLVQKCAATKSELTALTLTCEGLTEGLDKCKRELKQQTRVAEELPALRTKHEELTKEKQVLEGRVESTKQLEDKLVQAKETIAYMELAQSRTINMSQYAELEAERDRMKSSMEPLTRRLEETTKEVERLRNVTEAQQTVSNTQQTAVQNFKDQVEVLTDSECKMRESVATLSAENSRLQKLNASLEAQMNDMQDGIKEMAVHMDRERGNARIAAEAAQQKEVDDLRAQLAKATATLAEVEASRGEQVSEGLYKSVVNERTSLTNDLAKTQGEVERLKSEILIYRQTILDLEAENDEHVKELESMQERLQTDRSGLGDKLASEQHKISEIRNELEVLKEEYAAKEKLCEEQKASITSLEEKQIAQQRAFENRCRSDEPLNDRIAMLTTSLEEARGTEATLHSQLTAAQEALEAERTQVEELKHQVAVAEEAKSAALAERDVPDADENAREHLERENASLREEVERLRLMPVPVATPISTPPPEVAKSPDMAGLPPAPRSASAAKKLKKVPKKKRSLAEQMNESDEVDVLAAPAAVTATSEATETDASRLQQAQANLSRAQREVESLSMQNATLKEKISQMTNTHQQWQQDMSAQQAKYRSELEALQSNQGAAAAISAHQSKSDSSEAELKKATKQLRQKDAEIKAISDQLLPTKGKLAAYMAVTDRLGISYPFPDDVARVVLQHLQPTGLTNGRRAHRSQRDDIAGDSLR